MIGAGNMKACSLLIAFALLSKSTYTLGQECKMTDDYCSCDYSSTTGSLSGTVSLKSVAKNDGTPMWKDYQGSDGAKYSYNPCYAFTENTECTNVAACQKNDAGYYSLGPQDSVKMTVDSSSGNVLFTYSALVEGNTRIGVVTLECKQGQKETIFTAKGQRPSEANENIYYYDLTVSGGVACPGGYIPSSSSSNSLSPGSIMCIIFFVLLVVYIVAGVLYNKYRRGAEGKELVPNVEFWSDLPFLVKDGVLFAIKPCKKSGEYEQI